MSVFQLSMWVPVEAAAAAANVLAGENVAVQLEGFAWQLEKMLLCNVACLQY
jgi:hypothetical protein